MRQVLHFFEEAHHVDKNENQIATRTRAAHVDTTDIRHFLRLPIGGLNW